MTAPTQPTAGVDTLAAWLTAYLAAPASAHRASFSLGDLLSAAGQPRTAENEAAMSRAARHAGLVRTKRDREGVRAWAWERPNLVKVHQTTGNAAFLHGHTEGDRRFAVFDPGAPEGDSTAVAISCHTVEGWRFELGGLLRPSRVDADAIKAYITGAPDRYRVPLPPVPAPNLDDLVDRAREAVQQTAERAAARHWAFYQEGSLDILGRLNCAIAIHKLQALQALDIPEARP